MTTTIATEAYQADTFHPARTGARTGIAAALGRMLTALVTLQSRRADRMPPADHGAEHAERRGTGPEGAAARRHRPARVRAHLPSRLTPHA